MASKRHFVREFISDDPILISINDTEQDLALSSDIAFAIPSGAVIEAARLDFELYHAIATDSAGAFVLLQNPTNPMELKIKKTGEVLQNAMVWPGGARARLQVARNASTTAGNPDIGSIGGCTFKGTVDLTSYLTTHGDGNYELEWHNIRTFAAGSIMNISGVGVLTVEFSIDDIAGQSSVSSHILAQSEVDSELQSKLVSHVLEQSEVDSEILSSIGNLSVPGQSTTQSMITSHALEQNTEEGATQSEIASHVVALSESDSELLSHALEQGTEEGATQSEIASHALEQSIVLSESVSFASEQNTEEGYTQSEIASHALEQSEILSEAISALAERDTDLSEISSELSSHVLEQSQVLSQIESSADLIEPNDSSTQSEIASHALEQSEILSEATSALAERDTDLSEIKSEIASHALEQSEALSSIELDTGTTIPAQITQHDTDIKALPNVKATPEYLVIPSGSTTINQTGGITAIATSIPVNNIRGLETEGVILIESEYITYTGITTTTLTLTGCTRGAYGSSGATHADNVAVSQVYVYPIRLSIFDNAGNMVVPDTAPTIQIVDWNDTEEVSATAMTLVSAGLYRYNYIVDATMRPEPRMINFVVVENSITRNIPSMLMLLDEPASAVLLETLVGGGAGEYWCDHLGWYDSAGTLTAWGDTLAGAVMDVNGALLDEAYVTAFIIVGGEVQRSGRPSGQATTKVDGTWLMKLDAGTYQFVIEKEGFIITDNGTVSRSVG